MGNITILVAAVAIAFILVYFFFKLGENKNDGQDNHFILQILVLALLLGTLLIIGKVALDDQQSCEIVLNQTYETYIYGDNYTGYHFDYDYTPPPQFMDVNLFHRNTTNTYTYLCFDNPNNTANTLYNVLRWFTYMASLYIFGYLIWKIYSSVIQPLIKNGIRLKK